jgi:PhnB protein
LFTIQALVSGRRCRKELPAMTKAIPEGYPSVRPYLHVDGAAEAIDFYEKAFGTREQLRLEIPGGKIAHAEIEIADSLVMLCDPLPQFVSKPPRFWVGRAARC